MHRAIAEAVVPKRLDGQWPQGGAFFGKHRGHLPLRRAVNARVGPVLLPPIQIRLRRLDRLEAQPLQRCLLRVTDAGFDFPFAIGIADAARQRDDAVVRQDVAIEGIECRVVDIRREHAFAQVVEYDDLDGTAQPTKGLLVELRPDLRTRSPRQQTHALARVAERQHEQAHPPVLAAARVAHHRPVAPVVDLAFFAGRGRDHDARLGRGGAAHPDDEPADTGVPRGEAVIVDEVLPDRHRVAAAAQGLRNQLAVRLAGARRRRPTGPHRPARVGGHLADGGRSGPGVGGHLSGNCRFWRTFARPTPSTDRKPGGPQVPAHRDAMHARRAANARQRPPQATERENLLLLVWLQDVAHGPRGTTRPSPPSTSRSSANCRF